MKQTFNLSPDIFSSFIPLFCWLVLAIIVAYLFVIGINLLRDKFIAGSEINTRASFVDLMNILGTLLFIAGFGFIVANIFQQILSGVFGSQMKFPGQWNYLTFGIISVFTGIAFKKISKSITKKELEIREDFRNK